MCNFKYVTHAAVRQSQTSNDSELGSWPTHRGHICIFVRRGCEKMRHLLADLFG